MKKPKSPKEQMRIDIVSEQMVVRRNDAIQKSRYSLTLQETKCVQYAISLIQPGDTGLKEYTMDLKVLYDLCEIEKNTYTMLKQSLQKLSDKSWWITLDDGSESLVRWFTTLRSNKRSGKVTVKFHEDMVPYLLQLAEQYRSEGLYYTQYPLKFILTMHSKYGPRLYELLKSYAKNNPSWGFGVDELKHRLDCENYVQWNDFKRYVLTPAIKDINLHSDIHVTYETEKDGRRIDRINFKFSKVVDAPAYPSPDLVDPELVKTTFVDPDGAEYENILI